MKPLLLSTLLLLAPGSGALAQRPDAPARDEEGGRASGKKEKQEIKPYDEVVTEGFTTSSGLFRVHREGNRILYEILPEALGKDLLWVTQIAETQAGFGFGGTGVGNRVVRWEMHGDNVLLRDVKYALRAAEEGSIVHSVEKSSLAPILASLPVLAWGKDRAPVVDVSALFTDDVREFSAKERLGASGVDKDRTFVESIKAFPRNVETRVLMTYRLNSEREGGGSTPSPRGPRGGGNRDRSLGAVTVLLHHSMIALPDAPMTPRVFDDRVGFFSVAFEEYGSQDQAVETVRYVTRWRLEKKDPSAAISEPAEPIVFYVGREVPEKWRPWVKQGIEMWRPAFEAAGFANAIRAEDPPDEREDPDWDAEDARYSVIRWLPATIENAMGPHVHDPRTGEILEADILVYHNVIKLVRDWYFVQASPNDPRAQALPLPDDVIGEALAYVIAHEVGHSLGFPHNMKASSSYTVEELRDAEFTAKYGTEASIMDYGRFNYVAQPGDGARLIPLIGPYDFFAVEWGYRSYAGPEEEQAGLEALVAKQVGDPKLRFGDPNPGEDPSQQTEDLGSDPIRSTELGLLNIDRVAGYLVDACCKEGEDYDTLRNMYDALLGQRDRELGHVANVIGGFTRENLWYGDAERVYHPVDAAKQREALAFLQSHAFQTPTSILGDDVLLRLESNGAPERVLRGQRRLLETLMSEERIDRMAEHVARAGADAYAPVEMLAELATGIWSELDAEGPVVIDLYRRNLQRAHVELLGSKLTRAEAGAQGSDEGTSPTSDLPALARGLLAEILRRIDLALASARAEEDVTTRLHLLDAQARIRQFLNPLLEREDPWQVRESLGTLPARGQ